MGSRHDDVFDPTQPTLIVTCGNTSRKHRSLNRDVVLVGSAQGCDVGLDAIGVLPVHCVIIRYEKGFMLRNCAGHGGTRLNGESVLEAPLHDADALQIGPFSFQVYIPASTSPPAETKEPASIDQEQLRHLLRSRRHLARLALGLRQRVHAPGNGETPAAADNRAAARFADADKREAALHRQSREQEQRAIEFRELQSQLTAERAALDQARAALKLRVQEVENHLAHRKATIEADLQARKEEFQRWCQEQERPYQERMRAVPAAVPATEERERLAIRARELDHLAQHLQRQRQELEAARQQSTVEKAAEPFNGEGHQPQSPQAEFDWFQHMQAEKDRLLGEARQQVTAESQRWQKDVEELRRQADSLRAEIEEKSRLIQHLQSEPAAKASQPAQSVDIEGYEAELNEYRRQMDAERRALDEETQHFKQRQAELDDAVREAEIELSRDRAQIARERIQLERLRDEIRMEQERTGADEELQNRLAACQRLRESEPR